MPLNSFRLENLSRRELIIPLICSLGQNLRKVSDMYEYKEEESSKHRPVFSDKPVTFLWWELLLYVFSTVGFTHQPWLHWQPLSKVPSTKWDTFQWLSSWETFSNPWNILIIFEPNKSFHLSNLLLVIFWDFVAIVSRWWCSVAQSCLTLCHLMDCSIPGFPVLHYLPQFTQTHVHWVDDAIQPSHAVSAASPQSFPSSGCFPVSWLLTSGGQRIGVSASASVLPMSLHGWFPLGKGNQFQDIKAFKMEIIVKDHISWPVQKGIVFSSCT